MRKSSSSKVPILILLVHWSARNSSSSSICSAVVRDLSLFTMVSFTAPCELLGYNHPLAICCYPYNSGDGIIDSHKNISRVSRLNLLRLFTIFCEPFFSKEWLEHDRDDLKLVLLRLASLDVSGINFLVCNNSSATVVWFILLLVISWVQ